MATLEEKLCPVCFREAMEGGKCQNCGYVSDEASVGKNYLRSFSILNTKYLLGKSLGQGGFGITYLAKNMLNGSRCCIKEYFPSNLIQGRMPDGTVALTGEENRCEFEDGKQRFIEEARTLQELRGNVSVVDIQDFFEENGTAIGYSMLAISYSTEFGGICVWIEDLYMKPQYRGKGVGTAFFAFLESEYGKKAVRFRLEVEGGNAGAIAMYKKSGFSVTPYVQMTKEF